MTFEQHTAEVSYLQNNFDKLTTQKEHLLAELDGALTLAEIATNKITWLELICLSTSKDIIIIKSNEKKRPP